MPIAFLAAAFLAPLAPPITAQIEAEARATLADVFRIARRQRRRMLRTAERTRQDMTGALVELVADPETRRIIGQAYAAIRPPSQQARVDELSQPATSTTLDPSNLNEHEARLPTPNVSATRARGSKRSGRSAAMREPSTGPRPVRSARRTKQRSSGGRWSAAEQRVRAVVARNPHVAFDDVVRLASVSPSTASKWLKVIAAERTPDTQLSSA